MLSVARVTLVGLVLSLGAAGPALGAGTVTRGSAGSQITYATAGPAAVVLTDAPAGAGTALTLAEPGIGLGAMAVDCVDNGDSVTCTFGAEDDSRVSTTLSSGNDVFNAGATTRSTITVQDFAGGDDVLTGGNLALSPFGPTGDTLRPGPGTDQVFGGEGNDQLGDGGGGANELVEGGPGDDSFITVGPDPTGDTLRGGSGRDSLWARSSAMPSENFTVDLAAGTITEASAASAPDVVEGFEEVRTDDGNDVLLGTDGPNMIESGSGNDRIDGRLGSDLLFAEAGDDRIEAQDGIADRVVAGADADTCLLDQLDESAECETLEIATLTPFGALPPPDLKPMSCRLLRVPARYRSRALRRSGIAVTADCDEPGRVTARLIGRLMERDIGGARATRAGDIELARRSATLGAGDDARLRLRIGRPLRRLARRGVVLRVELRAVDSAGNRTPPLARRMRLR